MDTLAHQLGKTLVARGAVAAISRWGFWRVAGFVGAAAAVAWYLAAHRKPHASATPLLPAPPDNAAARTPDEERRRTPEVDTGAGYPEGTRTLH